jgi:uncharacterized protein YcfJ
MNRMIFALLLVTGSVSIPAYAVDSDVVIGSALGGAVGAVVGSSLGGRQSTIVGAGIGAATGAAITTKSGEQAPRGEVAYEHHDYEHHDNGHHYGHKHKHEREEDDDD